MGLRENNTKLIFGSDNTQNDLSTFFSRILFLLTPEFRPIIYLSSIIFNNKDLVTNRCCFYVDSFLYHSAQYRPNSDLTVPSFFVTDLIFSDNFLHLWHADLTQRDYYSAMSPTRNKFYKRTIRFFRRC